MCAAVVTDARFSGEIRRTRTFRRSPQRASRRQEGARVRRHGQSAPRPLPADVHEGVQHQAHASRCARRSPPSPSGLIDDMTAQTAPADLVAAIAVPVPFARDVRPRRLAVRGSPVHHRVRRRPPRAHADRRRRPRSKARELADYFLRLIDAKEAGARRRLGEPRHRGTRAARATCRARTSRRSAR